MAGSPKCSASTESNIRRRPSFGRTLFHRRALDRARTRRKNSAKEGRDRDPETGRFRCSGQSPSCADKLLQQRGREIRVLSFEESAKPHESWSDTSKPVHMVEQPASVVTIKKNHLGSPDMDWKDRIKNRKKKLLSTMFFWGTKTQRATKKRIFTTSIYNF